MNISKKVKQGAIAGLVGLVFIVSMSATADLGYNLGYFHSHVYGYAKTHREKDLKEKEFFNKTGLDINRMSILDKYVYGRSLTKGYID